MRIRTALGGWSLLLIALAFGSPAFGQASDTVVNARGYASVDGIRPRGKFKVAVALEIAPAYHINAHIPTLDFLIPTTVEFQPAAGLRIGEPKYPASQNRKFEFADVELAVHEGTVIVVADAEAESSIKPGSAVISAKVTVQSCNETQCLAPSDILVEIPIRFVAAQQKVVEINGSVFGAAAASVAPLDSTPSLVQYKGSSKESNEISELITRYGLAYALGFVFLAGLALNTTPCVYPIIPITIGFFVNQSAAGGKPKLRKTFLMALMYMLGMAVTYSLLGVAASKTGGLFGGALQNPVVLIALAAVMAALSLSMFGVYEFRLPHFLNQFVNQSTQSTSGALGALVMGLTMGIVAAPCIGPFVLALLVFVGEKGDALFGFLMFFVLALGLGLPYLILGTFSGAIKALPRSGEWMITVRKVFGLVLIGMALYFLMPLMGSYTNYIFVAFFALSAVYLILIESGRARPRQFAWVLRAIGAGATVVAVTMAIPKTTEAGIAWQPYSEEALAAAKREGRGVIIDTFADWCIPCKELDKLTFADRAVKKEAERFVTLKLDLTANDPQSEAGRARKRFDIRGVPTIIFIDPSGREIAELRVNGFEKAAAFLARMKQAPSDTGGRESANPSGENEPRADAAPTTGVEGEPLPPVTLDLLGGGKLDPQSWKGKVVLVDFWATWCLPCISEIPIFNDFVKKYGERGFEMVGVSLDVEGAAKVKPFLKSHPMNYTQTLGDDALAGSFGIADASALPVAVLIDKQGRIRFRHIGLTTRETFESEINQLLSE